LLTLNQIHAQIVTLANAHYQIAEVGMGTIAELQGKPDRSYPLLWLSNEGGSLDQNYKIDNIRLTMFGRVIAGEEGQDDDASEIEVLSDMQLILLDFLNYFHQQHGQEYVTDKAAQLEHFTERTNDRTAGYSCVLELKQFYDWNKCQIPESGASIPPSVDGLTLYDFCDQSVIDRLTQVQRDCLIAEFGNCADATVENSNASYTATVASGATLVLPNITFTDSDGSTSSVPSVQDITATPCVSPSLSIATSNATPTCGDSVTINATANGFTPVGDYTFSVPQLNGTSREITQASNVLVWNAQADGERTIMVRVSDGTNDVIGSVVVDVQWIYFDELTAATPSQAIGFYKASSAYAGAWAKVKRLDTGVEQDIPFNGNIPDWQALRTFGELAECRYIRIYDSFGNGNDWFTSTLAEQPLAMLNGAIPNNDGVPFIPWIFANKLNTASGGSNTPIYNGVRDVYTTVHTSSSKFSLLNAAVNASQSKAIFANNGDAGAGFGSIGTPSMYVDGTYIGTTSPTRDALHDLLVGNAKTVSIITANTSATYWGFGNYVFGYGYVGQWYHQYTYISDTSAEKTDIEAAVTTLMTLKCI